MFHRLRTCAATLLLLAALGATSAAPAAAQPSAEAPGLTPFANDVSLRAYFRAIADEERRRNLADHGSPNPLPPPPPPPPPPPAPSTPGVPAALNITNNQITGVDEGDIVKMHGQTLVILRRGRLFTLSVAGGAMRPVAAINAFPPGVDGRGDWYDEMLVAGDRVIVIGYSYARGGTQVNRFHIDSEGALSFEDSYQLRGGDYYSSRNYASRLIGNRLILYSPAFIPWQSDAFDALPALRQWQPGSAGGAWRRIASAPRVFLPNVLRDVSLANVRTMHGITSCDVTAATLDCDATVVLGSFSRTFFVSNNAIYLWIGSAWKNSRHGANAFIYRVPFDGGRPQAIQVRGMPIDQFSFHPDAARSALEVVVRADGGGDSMWRPEATAGDVALLSIPMSAFGSGALEVPLNRYQGLPKPSGNAWEFHNRFVGDHLLYSGGSSDTAPPAVTILSLADRNPRTLQTAHGIDRIDAIGGDAVVIGAGDHFLGFTAIGLASSGPSLGETFRLADAREGETRSHAFFFHPDSDSADGGSGMLGLPVARSMSGPGRPFLGDSAAMLFLTRRGGHLALAGDLAGHAVAGTDADDGCQASCVDWYGNARPIFLGDRTFALLGYELIEGTRRGDRVSEVGRTSFAPQAPPHAQ